MNPSSNPGPELQLPTPVVYNPPAEQVVGQTLPLPEQVPRLAEQAPLPPQPTTPAAGKTSAPLAGPIPSLPPQNDVTHTTNVVVPAAAEDNDLIEKEWVTKAKQLIEKTRDDPYLQSQELTNFKADYMQKRYNKVIKLSE